MRSRSPGSSSVRVLPRADVARGVQDRVGVDARLAQLALADVVLGVVDRLLEHALDLLVGETVRRLHLDRALAPGAQVGRRDAQDAVRVDQERHLERAARPPAAASIGIVKRARLRLSAASSRSPWSTWTSTAVWLSTAVVKCLLDARRDRRVAVDQAGEDAAHRLDAERQRHDVEQQHVRAGRR